MKKMIAVLILAGAAATPAFASDGSDVASQAQPAYVAMSNGMGAYASARSTNWQHAQDANIRHQEQIQWDINANR